MRPHAVRQILAVAAIVWLLLEVLRGWTPLLITVVGRAAETPPELIGLFSLAVTAVPVIALGVAGNRLHQPATLPALALGALLTRLVLPFASGRSLLAVASVGVVLALLALALAASRFGRSLGPGLMAGLALAATTHAALGTWGAVWRRDLAGALVTAALAVLVVVSLRHLRAGDSRPAALPVAWLVLPVLLLAGITLANPARALVITSMGAMVAAAACVGGALLAMRPWPRGWRVVAAVGVVVATAVTMLREPLDVVSLAGVAAGMPALGVLLGGIEVGTARPERVARVVATSAIGFTVLLFVFYAGYDLGYRADWVVVALALVVAVVALLAEVGTTGVALHPRAPSLVLAAAVVAGAGPLATVRALPDGDPDVGVITVAAWNLRMGYGMDGTWRPHEVAEVLRGEGADVVLLSEIDRGWLLNGGQDQLGVLARLLGYDLAFGPAGDQVWGDAILSRWPLADERNVPLPGYDSLTGATALTATVTPSDDTEVQLVATHLQPDSDGEDPTVRQARDVARLAREAKGAGPVVVGGDFNFEPGSGSWQAMLDAGLTDALAEARPLLTSRSDRLEAQIDHVFVSADLQAARPRTRSSLLSDHLPVVVDVKVARE